MIQPQVPLCSACDKGGPVTAFANDGSYWPNMGRFRPNFPTLGEYREKHAYYMLYTSNALSTKTSKILGPNLRKKIEPLFVTGNLWYLCCKPVCNLYFTNTDRYFETVFRSFLVFSNLLQLSSVKNCLRPWNKASPGPPGTLLFSELCGIPSTGCGIPSTGCDFILCVPFKRAQRLFERDAFTETFNMRELRLKRVVVHFIRKSRIRLCNTLSKGYGIP